ncbi:hypothetical protein SK128_028191 [Halocaridina rubra]|uniref:Uncharacterized protein n=1 Tax=Halocaridina rubra TaxID=373956 RepID=A0AAN9A2L6_HALRR
MCLNLHFKNHLHNNSSIHHHELLQYPIGNCSLEAYASLVVGWGVSDTSYARIGVTNFIYDRCSKCQESLLKVMSQIKEELRISLDCLNDLQSALLVIKQSKRRIKKALGTRIIKFARKLERLATQTSQIKMKSEERISHNETRTECPSEYMFSVKADIARANEKIPKLKNQLFKKKNKSTGNFKVSYILKLLGNVTVYIQKIITVYVHVIVEVYVIITTTTTTKTTLTISSTSSKTTLPLNETTSPGPVTSFADTAFTSAIVISTTFNATNSSIPSASLTPTSLSRTSLSVNSTQGSSPKTGISLSSTPLRTTQTSTTTDRSVALNSSSAGIITTDIKEHHSTSSQMSYDNKTDDSLEGTATATRNTTFITTSVEHSVSTYPSNGTVSTVVSLSTYPPNGSVNTVVSLSSATTSDAVTEFTKEKSSLTSASVPPLTSKSKCWRT